MYLSLSGRNPRSLLLSTDVSSPLRSWEVSELLAAVVVDVFEPHTHTHTHTHTFFHNKLPSEGIFFSPVDQLTLIEIRWQIADVYL